MNVQVTAFYILSIVLASLCMLLWELPANYQPGDVAAMRDAYQRVGLIYGFAPAVAALIVAFAYGKGRGLADLLRRIFIWRISPLWCLVALLLPVLAQWFGVYVWSEAFDEPLNFPAFSQWVRRFLMLAAINGLFSVGEELGWRGFMLPRVLTTRSWIKAAFITGVFWAPWHYPLWGVANFALTGSMAQTATILLLASIQILALSLAITAIFLRTRESLIPVLLLHGANNANMGLIYEGVSDRALTSIPLLAINTVSYLLVVGLVLLLWRRFGAREKVALT